MYWYLVIAVVVMASPLTAPALLGSTELLTNSEADEKQVAVANF